MNGNGDVEMGVEATEQTNGHAAENGGGFLRKTISKIWSTSSSSVGKAEEATEKQQPQQQQEAAAAAADAGGSSCVIS
jgi:hypothetical protein